jgi:hypothetical protein
MTRKVYFVHKTPKQIEAEKVLGPSSKITLADAEEVTYSRGTRDGAIIERS